MSVSNEAQEQAYTKALELEESMKQEVEQIQEEIEQVTETPETPAETPVETSQNETPEQPTTQEDSRFEQIKRLNKELRAAKEELKQAQSTTKELEEMRSLAKADPIKFMDKVGLTYDSITDAILGNTEPEETKKVSELESRIAKFEESQKQLEEQRELQRMQAEAQKYINSLNEFIDSSEELELIKATKSHQLVVNEISNHYNETQEELPWEVAAKKVEDQLWESEVERARSILKLEKMRSKLGIDDKATKSQSAEVKSQSRTLSNKNTAAIPERVSTGKPMTFEESLERARLLEEELKRKGGL